MIITQWYERLRRRPDSPSPPSRARIPACAHCRPEVLKLPSPETRRAGAETRIIASDAAGSNAGTQRRVNAQAGRGPGGRRPPTAAAGSPLLRHTFKSFQPFEPYSPRDVRVAPSRRHTPPHSKPYVQLSNELGVWLEWIGRMIYCGAACAAVTARLGQRDLRGSPGRRAKPATAAQRVPTAERAGAIAGRFLSKYMCLA